MSEELKRASASDVCSPENSFGENFAISQVKYASSLALMYGGPMYIVGSSLHKKTKEEISDVDIRCVLNEEDLDRLFGSTEEIDERTMASTRELKIWREALKQSRRWWSNLPLDHRVRIDFQFQTREEFESKAKRLKTLRLDGLPDDIFDAGRNRP